MALECTESEEYPAVDMMLEPEEETGEDRIVDPVDSWVELSERSDCGELEESPYVETMLEPVEGADEGEIIDTVDS
mgnify:FL=1